MSCPSGPKGGPGRARPEQRQSRVFLLGRGDLLVTGGLAQRTWEHAVPKVARAGPRLSLAFRNGLELRGYVQEENGALSR